jgi:putative oxidoreductase
MKNIVDLIGRIFLSSVFIFEAIDTLKFYEETRASLTNLNIVWQQDFLMSAGIIILFLGAVLFLTGYRTGFATIILLIYWIPATFLVYDFWTFPKGEQRVVLMIFTKNLAIMGGMLILWVNGSKAYSIRKILATTKVR